jgi:chromosomal replication initiation ATPase DnaA
VEQLGLPLRRRRPPTRDNFIVSACNEAAVRLVDTPDLWPDRRLCLVGPAGSGKSHLARVWADRVGARIWPGSEIETLRDQPVLVDDADRVRDDFALFRLFEMTAAKGALLLTGESPPREWPVSLPDLKSRLAGLTVTTLGAPDDALARDLLVNLFAERNIRPKDDVIPYLVSRVERTAPAFADIVDRIDRLATASGREITRALAAELLAEPDLFEGE